jgi:mannose-1-phosphate guanylyltransferase
LRPFTGHVPKPMLPVLGRPLLAYVLDQLRAAGVQRVVLACGYRAGQIEHHFGDEFAGMQLEYRVEDEPRGTGGGILVGASGITSTFLACNGDSLREADLARLLAFHRERAASATILVAHVDDPSRYGLVEIDEEGRVRAFIEKPTADEADAGLINAGLYVLEPEVLDLIDTGRSVSIEREVFPVLAARGELYALHLPGFWLDVGTPESYLQAHFDLLDRASRIDAHPSSDVDPSATLTPPVSIGAGAAIRPGANVGPYVYLGPGARIEAGAVVERAVLLPDAVVAAETGIVEAIVAPRSMVVS